MSVCITQRGPSGWSIDGGRFTTWVPIPKYLAHSRAARSFGDKTAITSYHKTGPKLLRAAKSLMY